MKKLLALLLLLLPFVVSNAQIRGSEIQVLVSPDHADWNYKINEKATFTIQVLKAQNPMEEVVIDYELGPEMFPDVVKKNVKVKGSMKLQATMKTAGFLRCKVTAHVDGKQYNGSATAGYQPDQLQPISRMPEDFSDYWQGVLTQARTTPLDLKMVLMPERCTELDNVYQVSYQTKARGGRFYGVLSVPKRPGKYPALLRVPGAGVRPYSGDTYTASGKVIVLEVGVHGVPIDMKQSVYNDLMAGALNNYWHFRKDNRDQFYYNRVIVGALRAVDVIYSLPQHDGKTLGVTGSSQGGALSIITAALDNRVTFLAPVHPALCDHEAFLKKRAGGWPHYFYNNPNPSKAEIETARYYDTSNFARLLKVPGWYSWGYNDDVCPPTSMHATYNIITAPKEFHPYLQTAHFWYQEQWDAWQNWLRQQLGVE